MTTPTGARADGRRVLRSTGGSVLGGWLAGAVAHELLVRFMLARGWLDQTRPLTPEPLSLEILVAGVAVGVLVTITDIRSATDHTSARWASARAVGTSGVVMITLGLWHAHGVGQLVVREGMPAFWIDQLYHDPGIALAIAGWYLRPTTRRR